MTPSFAPTPEQIVGEFWRQSRSAGHPTQAHLDKLTKIMGIPIMALASSADSCDFPIAMFRVVRNRTTFEFSDDETVRPVVGFVAWGPNGAAQDLAAWSPRDNWLGTWLGQAAFLSEHKLDEPRLGEPLHVFLNVSDWLRASRRGVVVIDRGKAARLLEGLTIQAINVAEGLELRKLVERPRARIVVPAREPEKAAA